MPFPIHKISTSLSLSLSLSFFQIVFIKQSIISPTKNKLALLETFKSSMSNMIDVRRTYDTKIKSLSNNPRELRTLEDNFEKSISLYINQFTVFYEETATFIQNSFLSVSVPTQIHRAQAKRVNSDTMLWPN